MNESVTAIILKFLREIGLPVSEGLVPEDSFLPGIEVRDGGLIVDVDRLKYPGDLLHEAGHLAVVPSSVRKTLGGKVETPGEPEEVIEVIAMLWSYAACLHLKLDPHVVFHEHGYYGRSEGLLFNYQLGVYAGVQGLHAAGMALTPQDAESSGREPFPAMEKWMRD